MLPCGLLGAAGPAHGCQEASIVLHAGCRSVSGRSSLHGALGNWSSLDRPLIAMVGASVGSSWRACAPMSLPCFFLWLEFEVAAGPGPRSLDHSGRGALCPAALLPAKP